MKVWYSGNDVRAPAMILIQAIFLREIRVASLIYTRARNGSDSRINLSYFLPAKKFWKIFKKSLT